MADFLYRIVLITQPTVEIKFKPNNIPEGKVDCLSFTHNTPLYIARVIRGDAHPTIYVTGSRSGVHYRILPTSDQKD